MNHAVLFLLASALGAGTSAADWKSPHPLVQEERAPVALLPFPAQVEWTGGRCSRQVDVKVRRDASLAETLGPEGYQLTVAPTGVTIAAATSAGVFYARQTLAQLGRQGDYPCCRIVDKPAFAYRGFMHDTGRNFRSIATLKADLDMMAQLKLNVFHWHLTDYPAWRIQCKKYPVLNDPAKRIAGRDVNDTYSYDQIRDVIRYAKKRHIMVIPEIDMPGHSTYFKNCFGFAMNDPRGMEILEELLEEFCREIPVDMAPFIHIGADEIHIPNAHEFADRMSSKVKSLGRRPIQWAGSNDLPVSENSCAQLWTDEASAGLPNPARQKRPYFDSTSGYVNAFDPALIVRRNFFRQPCGTPRGDGHALGVIQCLWPDTRVEDKKNIPLQSPQWPAMFAMAERSWKGLAEDGTALAGRLPGPRTEAGDAFALFEKRLEALAGARPFPYWRDSFVTWQVYGPVADGDARRVREELLKGDPPRGVEVTQAHGGNLYFRSRAGGQGLFPEARPGQTVWAETFVNAPRSGVLYAMVGFDAPARSTRRCSGVPAAGQWSQCGTRIWINGRAVDNPQTYQLAGQRRYEGHTWNSPDNEISYDNEEFWWARPPVAFRLKPGRNRILIEQPYTGSYQSWGVSFIPVCKRQGRWVADPSVVDEKKAQGEQPPRAPLP